MSTHLIVRVAAAILLTVVLVSGWSGATADEPKAGEQVKQQFTTKDADGNETTLHYWLYLPAKHDGKTKLPLLMFLHGSGERGDDLEVVKKHGPPKICTTEKDWAYITVSPQCPKDKRWDATTLAKLVDHVAAQQQADEKRLYITGLSMGGSGSWALATNYPDKFAAAVPMCGRGDAALAEKLIKLPIWVFHGAKDVGSPVALSETMVEAIKKAGGEKVKLTIDPDAGHDCWTTAYGKPELYQWLLEQKRP
ncbi:Prolyl oligopeptidase family protein [Anatilimnocola aggregata]|uniref:Prolyl oligopeptidase family protein n=1 Tax=Anatilimnocola aggregata TaxID=2528021 RepID=A0A517YD20_9BACT|nr:prolyl oligopeptidase family serine peptidase [Anatilimnocola aggregata]QDU28134.1 Prolyl oligopeptidase family protein [Anatilimnocola aggregata]